MPDNPGAMLSCQKCGAPARPEEELCRFCGSPINRELTEEETETLVKVFLESQEKALKGVNGPRVWGAFAACVLLPFAVYFGMRAIGTGWLMTACAVLVSVAAGFAMIGGAVQVEQDLFFERTLKGRIQQFLDENRLEKARLLLAAHKVVGPNSEVMKRLSTL